MNRIEKAIIELEEYSAGLDEGCRAYWRYHKKRYVWFIQLFDRILKSYFPGKKARILDIAPLYQTLLLHKVYDGFGPDTLGYRNGPFHPDINSYHYDLDLNDCYYNCSPLKVDGKYDAIVMLEVIEHLSTSPIHVFAFLKELLVDGGILVIQTPNAVSLRKRYRMLMGSNPFEMIRENMRDDPGHFREYTRDELCYLASISGFETREGHMVNYFDEGGSAVERMLNRISEYMPANFRNGMTLVFQKAP